jgi:hypothetical protein
MGESTDEYAELEELEKSSICSVIYGIPKPVRTSA